MLYQIANAKRLVVKIGSALLIDGNTGALHRAWLDSLIDDVAEYWQNGKDVIIVSSGAIALGRHHLQLKDRSMPLAEKQACAAVGQIQLSQAYQQALASRGIAAAQILLTLEDIEDSERNSNAKNTLEALLKYRIIPIINENDTVATAEISYGDNDRLAARVAQMITADTLVLLSDIDGLYTADPKRVPDARFIPQVSKLTATIEAMGGDSVTEYGSGGMVTKLLAAKIALASGCNMVISAGKHLHPLQRIDQIEKKTWFIADNSAEKIHSDDLVLSQ